MKIFFWVVLIFFGCLPAAQAQDLLPPVAPAMGGVSETSLPPDTDSMIRLTPDKSELVRLDQDAVSVVVGNPTHLSVLLDTPRLLILVPKAPGATSFSVLDGKGQVIMQRHAIVAAPKEKYVRIRRSCSGSNNSADCRQTSVYFCPDICHEVDVTQLQETPRSATGTTEEAPTGAVTAPVGEGTTVE
jgi:Flp pilus assembly secretin CpaC